MATLFQSDVLRKLARLEVVARKQLEGRRRGQRDVYRRGGTVEFADHRAYVPGDDLRYVDWNIYRRLGQLFVKQYEAEEDIELLLFVDRSASMVARPDRGEGGIPSKLDYARLLAGALGYVALSTLDAVRLVAFDDSPARGLRGPWRGKGNAHAFLGELEELTAGEATSTRLLGAVETGLPPGRGRGVAVLISDLFAEERQLDLALARLRSRRWQPFVVHVTDASERTPEISGRMMLVDAESGRRREVLVTRGLIERYSAHLERRAQRLAEVARRHESGFARVTTAMPFEKVILELLRRRGLVR